MDILNQVVNAVLLFLAILAVLSGDYTRATFCVVLVLLFR